MLEQSQRSLISVGIFFNKKAGEKQLNSRAEFSLKANFFKYFVLNPLSANPTKWSNTLKQFVDNLPTNCLSVFDHFVGLALKGLKSNIK